MVLHLTDMDKSILAGLFFGLRVATCHTDYFPSQKYIKTDAELGPICIKQGNQGMVLGEVVEWVMLDSIKPDTARSTKGQLLPGMGEDNKKLLKSYTDEEFQSVSITKGWVPASHINIELWENAAARAKRKAIALKILEFPSGAANNLPIEWWDETAWWTTPATTGTLVRLKTDMESRLQQQNTNKITIRLKQAHWEWSIDPKIGFDNPQSVLDWLQDHGLYARQTRHAALWTAPGHASFLSEELNGGGKRKRRRRSKKNKSKKSKRRRKSKKSKKSKRRRTRRHIR